MISGVSVSRVVTSIVSDSCSAADRAMSEGPTIRHKPSDSTSKVLRAAIGKAASASRAAIFGVADLPSSDHPARSRMSTHWGSGASSSAARSMKMSTSCAQAMIRSSLGIAFARESRPLVHNPL